MLVVAKQAGTDLAVSRESNAVAVSAKGVRDRGDNPDLCCTPAKGPSGGCLGGVAGGEAGERGFGLGLPENLTARNDVVLGPSLPGVKGHELDEAHDDVLIQGKLGQRHDFVVVKSPNNHSVDLQRGEANRLGQAYRFEHFRQSVTTGDFFEVVPVE